MRCVLTIEDDGPGVPESELDKLGVPFYRPASSHPGGCGLGLAIVKEIARLHDAQVNFAIASLSGGLRVSLTIPEV
jgi:two-component system sensor histidine kinase TctE